MRSHISITSALLLCGALFSADAAGAAGVTLVRNGQAAATIVVQAPFVAADAPERKNRVWAAANGEAIS